MVHYVVTWTIDIDADDPRHAARLARHTQMFGTEALTFNVFIAADLDRPAVEIDLGCAATLERPNA